MIWLVRFKAAMAFESSLNMDGSEYLYATGVVHADSESGATKELAEHLKSYRIEFLPDFATFEQYTGESVEGSAEEIDDIKRCLSSVNQNNRVLLANAISSEAHDYFQSTKGDE